MLTKRSILNINSKKNLKSQQWLFCIALQEDAKKFEINNKLEQEQNVEGKLMVRVNVS